MAGAIPRCTHSRQRIAIIGGGYSGTMVSVELLRRTAGDVSIVLIERGSVPGLGAAYGTSFDGHLLNVRARNMSAYADCPDHFVLWAQQNYTSSVKPEDFLPRPVYGQYIASQLREATRFRQLEFRCMQDEAASLLDADGQITIALASGQSVVADKVVLALGNFPPAELHLPGKTAASPSFIANPWSPTALSTLRPNESVLLIGSGLTSVDVMMELRARGLEGTIHMLSRRGLLPQRHAPIGVLAHHKQDFPRTARGLLRMLRCRVQATELQGGNWRQVIDWLRPFTQSIWRDLPFAEQRRVLRHLKPYWDVHRHRIAERVADQLTTQLGSGQIKLHAGRIVEYRDVDSGVQISYRRRHSRSIESFRVNHVVNCTGPEGDFRRVRSPLLANLLNQGLIRPDDHSLGLDVTDDGAVIDAQGIASNRLYALGPLRKGKLWESIAVPELRVQNAALAQLLLSHRDAGPLAYADNRVETVPR